MPDDDNDLTHASEDPLEEVLSQTSDQTLKLNHLDEGVRELKRQMTDVTDSLEAGLVELRGLVAAAPKTQPVATSSFDDAWRQSIGDRLDAVERQAKGVKKRTGVLVLLLVLQAGGTAFLVAQATRVGEPVEAKATIAPLPPLPPPARVEEQPPEPGPAPQKAKKKRHREL